MQIIGLLIGNCQTDNDTEMCPEEGLGYFGVYFSRLWPCKGRIFGKSVFFSHSALCQIGPHESFFFFCNISVGPLLILHESLSSWFSIWTDYLVFN